MSPRRIASSLLLAGAVAAVGDVRDAGALTPAQACEKTAAKALATCVRSVGRAEGKCYRDTGSTCAPGSETRAKALAKLGTKVTGACPDAATVTAAGYPPFLTPPTLVTRLQEACTSSVASLVARSFGGPHAAVRDAASGADQACLDHAYAKGLSLVRDGYRQYSNCVLKAHAGRPCDAAGVSTKIAGYEARTVASIAGRCTLLSDLIGIDPATFAARATAQSRCLAPAAHGQTAPLALDCGPRASVAVPPRATPTQIVLDGPTTGTRCGDGSPYAFWIRLAPTGNPVEKLVVFLPGGGACLNGPDCAATDPDLFESVADTMGQAGIMSSTSVNNPFRNWTKVFLPYCTQDLHIGGGVTNTFSDITVHRFGARNVQAALRHVRDVVWTELDATDPTAYRPDRPTVIISGSSAGSYGAAYNYDFLLDELQWAHTTSVRDAGLGMDNGGSDGVYALGALALFPTSPGWNVRPYLPPYCLDATCAETFIDLAAAQSARLKAVPDQQILVITNQVDTTQVATTNFASVPAFINELRASYCAIQGTPGVRSFLFASSSSIHGMINDSNWNTAAIGGTLLRDWVGGAMSAPDAVIDAIATGTLEADRPGTTPFPCTTGSPSGAFLDVP
jgi:hypothetical protein